MTESVLVTGSTANVGSQGVNQRHATCWVDQFL
jgi:hypothetical protein